MSEQILKAILEEMKTLNQKVNTIDTRMTKVEQSITRIENDHGTKLSALLDGYKQNSEILNKHTEQLDRIEDKVTHHDIKIAILDKTKSNKRIVKAK